MDNALEPPLQARNEDNYRELPPVVKSEDNAPELPPVVKNEDCAVLQPPGLERSPSIQVSSKLKSKGASESTFTSKSGTAGQPAFSS